MPLITFNEFAKLPQRICVAFHFCDYKLARRQANTNGKLKMKDGTELPTPNVTIRKLASSAIKNKYHVRSENPDLQILMLANRKEAQQFITAHSRPRNSDRKPCQIVIRVLVELKDHIELAKRLDLL